MTTNAYYVRRPDELTPLDIQFLRHMMLRRAMSDDGLMARIMSEAPDNSKTIYEEPISGWTLVWERKDDE